MSYAVTIELCDVVIPAAEVAACLAAINRLHADKKLLMQSNGGTTWFDDSITHVVDTHKLDHYAWVESSAAGFADLIEAFRAWRYTSESRPDGSIEIHRFDGEGWGDDEILYRTVAPYAKSGGQIKCRGHDGLQWGYRFEGRLLVPLANRAGSVDR